MSLWLTREELVELTSYKTPRKWRDALAQMNVRFRTRPDGFPLVDRAQFETAGKPVRRREPDFSWMGKA